MRKLKKTERVIILMTLLAFVFLCVKSLAIDGVALEEKFSEKGIRELKENVDLNNQGLFSKKIVKLESKGVRYKEEAGILIESFHVVVRKYFLYILPIGDSYYNVEKKIDYDLKFKNK